MRTRVHGLLSIAAATFALAVASLLPACRDAESEARARKAGAKRARDAELLKAAYPASSGALPGSITLGYDEASDRTTMTLRFTELRLAGPGAARVRPGSGSLSLTSAHDGRTRPTDNPEGSVDGVFAAVVTSPGVLAFSGVPGSISLDEPDEPPRPLREASGKGGYAGAASPAGGEESLRFRIRTEDLVAAAGAGRITLTLATVQIELTERQRAELREFTARLNPRP